MANFGQKWPIFAYFAGQRRSKTVKIGNFVHFLPISCGFWERIMSGNGLSDLNGMLYMFRASIAFKYPFQWRVGCRSNMSKNNHFCQFVSFFSP